MAWVMTPGIPRHQHHMVMQYNEENICTHNRKNICTHHTSMAHVINKQDLEDYIKSPVKKRGCTVDQVDRQKAHWYFIFHKAECMKEIEEYRADRQYYCSICGKGFTTRTSRNRHTRTVDCGNKTINVDKLKCDICDKELSSRSSRDRHKRTVHKPK